MKITGKQQKILASLQCERLSNNEENLRAIGSFCNNKNPNIVDTLQGSAYEEDESGAIAYYLIKDALGNILFYFSLKCGLLYDEFIEGEQLRALNAVYQKILLLLKEDSLGEEEKKVFRSILENTRAKKGIKKRISLT